MNERSPARKAWRFDQVHPRPGNVPGRPWHQIPLLIGTLMSALFSGYMAYYLAWPLAYLRRAMSDVAQGRFETRVKPAMGKRPR